ncbi:MAG: type IV toxin-antitoxin system AbiEi family antitoxin domain-containing protein [Fidelibacterota bacterium]
MNRQSAQEKAIKIIENQNGIISTSQALKDGIHPRTLYKLRDSGILIQLSRGIYKLENSKPLTNPDLVIVTQKVPNAVICLVSALAFHNITTQIPHVVSIAITQNIKTPQLDYPPIKAYRFTGTSLIKGVKNYGIDGKNVKIYKPEKTIADCFKFRNKIGMDIVLEALKLYKARYKFDHQKLLYYARICRVENIIKPYLEASL